MKNRIIASAIALSSIYFVAPPPAQAMWPFDAANKDASEQESAPLPGKGWRFNDSEQFQAHVEEMKEHWQEKLRTLADWLGWTVDQVKQAFEQGKRPADMAAEAGKDINEWHQLRLEERKEHMKEMGWSDEQIAAFDTRFQERVANGTLGQGDAGKLGYQRGFHRGFMFNQE